MIISIWGLRLAQKTGGLFNKHQNDAAMDGNLDALAKRDFLDDQMNTDDFLDLILQDSHDDFNAVCNPQSTFFENETYGASSILPSGSLQENYAIDILDLISLEKVLELHQTVSWETPNEQTPSHDDSERKPFTDEVNFSSLPDHNYFQTKEKCDESSSNDKTDTSDVDQTTRPSVKKTSKYLERRKKNNVASKRSREIRKGKYVEMEIQANELEEENKKLRIRIEKLEMLTQQMKEILVKRLTKD